MPVTTTQVPPNKVAPFATALNKSAAESGWNPEHQTAVATEFIAFIGEFNPHLLESFEAFLAEKRQEEIADQEEECWRGESPAVADEEEETCWECGGSLKYVETKANGILCECSVCGAEQMTSEEDDDDDLDDDEEEDDEEDEFEDDLDDEDDEDFDDEP
jgi:hypothetical protein